jgi:Zn-dependent protease with chaperone function
MLAGLLAITVANGFFLGFTVYGILAAAIRLIHGHAPPFAAALLVGAGSAVYLLFVSLRRERQLREGEYRLWQPLPAAGEEHPLAARLRDLTAATTLTRPPALGWIEADEMNAFVVGRSREEASIILTSGLIEGLDHSELDAVLAQQLAHVERDDVRAVGLADAIADSIEDLARLRSRVLWGPRTILEDVWPVLLVIAAMGVAIEVLPASHAEDILTILLVLVAFFGLFYALWQTALMSWRGLAQGFLFFSFFGPLTVAEAVLAPPTALLLSRLLSRARVCEADERAVALAGNQKSLAAALRQVAAVGALGRSPWLGERRYSLFVAPAPEAGRWPWLARYLASHPSIESRLETIASTD